VSAKTILIEWEKKRAAPKWSSSYSSEGGHHWGKLKNFLSAELGRSNLEISTLHSSTDETLRYLGNPNSSNQFNVRGLVIGYVQSGKTQHFSALASKAFDADYDIVVVLSGLENSLRNQTQKRMMRDLGHHGIEGVGESVEPANILKWVTDVDWGSAGDGIEFNSFVDGLKHVAVVKKNSSVLKNLLSYFENLVSTSASLLVIDDEADQASIDTTPLEEDPTTINDLIRQLLGKTERSTYVAYTATPSANILTDPSAWADPAGASLFPKDFIIALPEPLSPREGGKYTGTSAFFGSDPYKVFEEVSVPEARAINDDRGASTAAKRALLDYFLSSAALLQRSTQESLPPRVMLFHTAHTKDKHRILFNTVSNLVKEIRRKWIRKDPEFIDAMRKRWETSFAASFTERYPNDSFPSFNNIIPFLDSELRTFNTKSEILLINSDSDIKIDFDSDPSLRAIFVGGNKLSRGITLEGLLTSYYTRNTLAGDTLLQMGRWFGYRGDFVDLIRVYTTTGLYSDFSDLNQFEIELREEIAYLKKLGKKPEELPPSLSIHPGVKKFTAANKMYAAQVRHDSWANKEARTLRLPFEQAVPLQSNLESTRTLLSSLGTPQSLDHRYFKAHTPYWRTSDVNSIRAFIGGFNSITSDFNSMEISQYISRQNSHGELITWNVVVFCLENPNPSYKAVDLGITDGRLINPIKRTRRRDDPSTLGSVWAPGHDAFGLTLEEKSQAEKYEATQPLVGIHAAYRMHRSPQEALLVIYPISRFAVPDGNSSTQFPIYSSENDREFSPDLIAMAISFPASTSIATRSVLTVATKGTS
jgi:hypothetical protein